MACVSWVTAAREVKAFAQFTVLITAGVVLTPAIVIRAADAGESYLSWAVVSRRPQ